MSKVLIRMTVVYTVAYFLYTFWLACNGIQKFNDSYIILFELCVCSIMSSQGKYHCKYMRYTAYSILICDTMSRIDNLYKYLPVELVPFLMIYVALSAVVPFGLSLYHFYKVKRLKRKQDEFHEGRTRQD